MAGRGLGRIPTDLSTTTSPSASDGIVGWDVSYTNGASTEAVFDFAFRKGEKSREWVEN